jgi:hypothetical protein
MALELQRLDPWNGESITGTTYYGYSVLGAQDSEAKWVIKRKTVVGGILKYEWPYITGTTLQNSYPAIQVNIDYYMQPSGLVWSDRSGYTYR